MTINPKYLFGAIVIIALLCGAAYAGYHQGRLPAPVVAQVTQKELADPQALTRILHQQQGQIDALVKAIQAAQGQPPAVSYTVQAPTVQAAADKVTKEVKSGTAYALQVPGRQTLVAANTQQQKVDVYRITTEHARWGVNSMVLVGGGKRPEVGAGPAWMNRDNSAAIGYTSEKREYLSFTHSF